MFVAIISTSPMSTTTKGMFVMEKRIDADHVARCCHTMQVVVVGVKDRTTYLTNQPTNRWTEGRG